MLLDPDERQAAAWPGLRALRVRVARIGLALGLVDDVAESPDEPEHAASEPNRRSETTEAATVTRVIRRKIKPFIDRRPVDGRCAEVGRARRRTDRSLVAEAGNVL